jgi:hypothetical protein
VERWLAVIDELLAAPFPFQESTEDSEGGPITSGPGYHVAIVAQSEEFWDDYDGTASQAAYTAMEAQRLPLVEALCQRWGEPRTVVWEPPFGPLSEHLVYTLGSGGGTVWKRGDRLVCVDAPQADKELPFQLVLAVGLD